MWQKMFEKGVKSNLLHMKASETWKLSENQPFFIVRTAFTSLKSFESLSATFQNYNIGWRFDEAFEL